MEAAIPYDSNGNALINRTIAVSGQTVQAIQVNVPFDDVQSMLNQVLLRSGIAPLSGNLPAGGFKMTGLARGSSDGDSVNMSQLNAVSANVVNSAPPGAVQAFRRKTVPTGWTLEDGGTIGSALSGATNRANADTLALYTVLWTDFDNTELPIQTSGGVVTTRGASASADFGANKRMPLFDSRSRFLRGADSGLAYDTSLVVGLAQSDLTKSHTHTGNTNIDGAHGHDLQLWIGSGGIHNTGGGSSFGSNAPAGDVTGGVHSHAFTTDASGGSETRPRASVVLYCIKL